MSNDYYNSLSSSSMANSTSTASSTAANACTSTRWLTEEVFALIDLVQRNEAIYNPRHKYYFCRPYVENFWREVDLKLEKNRKWNGILLYILMLSISVVAIQTHFQLKKHVFVVIWYI